MITIRRLRNGSNALFRRRRDALERVVDRYYFPEHDRFYHSHDEIEVGPRDPGPKTYPFQKPNAPIMRRGIDGEPETTVPTEREEKPTGPK